MAIKSSPAVYWTTLVQDDWRLCLAATAKGLCYVDSQQEGFQALARWVTLHLPKHSLTRDDGRMQHYATQLGAYLRRELESFTVPLDLTGTPFQLAVWQAVQRIPYGATLSYSDIARCIGKPTATRAVGAAIGANPVLIFVPCHRVIGKDGSLTGFRSGLGTKRRLLQLERPSGVTYC